MSYFSTFLYFLLFLHHISKNTSLNISNDVSYMHVDKLYALVLLHYNYITNAASRGFPTYIKRTSDPCGGENSVMFPKFSSKANTTISFLIFVSNKTEVVFSNENSLLKDHLLGFIRIIPEISQSRFC